jgi:hypothetical protein
MALREWVRLPSAWIEDGGLKRLRWGTSEWNSGADCLASLMILMVISHYADETTGVTKVTYDEMSTRTGLSRSKISVGLRILEDLEVIIRSTTRQSHFELARFGLTEGWCKFPARRLYQAGRIAMFQDFNLRKPAELNALKLYYLFAARRGEDTNLANISYDTIAEYSGLDRNRIKTAISFLAAEV